MRTNYSFLTLIVFEQNHGRPRRETDRLGEAIRFNFFSFKLWQP